MFVSKDKFPGQQSCDQNCPCDKASQTGVVDMVPNNLKPASGWRAVIKTHFSQDSFRFGTLLSVTLIWLIPPLLEADNLQEAILWAQTAAHLSAGLVVTWLAQSLLFLLGIEGCLTRFGNSFPDTISAQSIDRIYTGTATARLIFVIIAIVLILPDFAIFAAPPAPVRLLVIMTGTCAAIADGCATALKLRRAMP
ncbi:hypothetical protein [Thalassospira sp.]|uniref:hypothetical protein n=1 Tax=Thalassospira sp. TaxID=1912094 RepID=UPI003AA8B8A7